MGHEGHDHEHPHGHGHDATHDPRDPGGAALGSTPGSLLHLDCFAGVSGDMLLGALSDLGVAREVFDRPLAALGLDGFKLRFEPTSKNAIGATRATVEVAAGQPERCYADIRTLLDRARLDESVRRRAHAAFRVLAEAEARVHRSSIEEVHFHEVGAVDAIVDIVGACAAIDHLGARLSCSPLPMGRATVQAAHGPLPVPAPAVLEIVAKGGIPIRGDDAPAELVTPTGAALVATQCERFGEIPSMRPWRIGYGAGTRDLDDRANLLRLLLGTAGAAATEHVVVEANIDDMTPEVAAWVVETLLAAGALDAWYTPIVMKKGRPALELGLLCHAADRERLIAHVLRESTTIGVRYHSVSRSELAREMITVETEFGPIAVKVASGAGARTASPEFEACRTAAQTHGVPLKDVYAAAVAALVRTRR